MAKYTISTVEKYGADRSDNDDQVFYATVQLEDGTVITVATENINNLPDSETTIEIRRNSEGRYVIEDPNWWIAE